MYLTDPDDATPDFATADGLDDDLAVHNAVARALQLEHLCLTATNCI